MAAAGEVKMGASSSGRFLRRRAESRAKGDTGVRALTASAALLDLSDKSEIRRVKQMRQTWQTKAWDYFDEIGEVSYAHQFFANCASRMRIFPAAYATGNFDEDPVPLSDVPDMPADVLAAATEAMNDLGSGRLAMASLMGSTSFNLSIAGEGYVLGITDLSTGESSFSIRSVDEIVIAEDKYKLRELPSDTSGATTGIDLNPDVTYLARIWTPHPRWRLFARSSMRSVLDVCEELQILNRVVRAASRNRSAQNGLLLIPDTISAEGQTEDNEDPQSDPFMSKLADAFEVGISDEGSASAAVPVVLRGPSDALEAIRHLILDRPLDPVMAEQRAEQLSRLATGLDLPKEVLTGMTDLNHWTAWQVSADTFSEHVEPHIVNCVDALTIGYFRGALMVDPRMQGANKVWLSRLCVWYDPVELLSDPNEVGNATAAHAAIVISDASYRSALGFSEEDAPSPQEIELRMVRSVRAYPPNTLEALLHMLDPTLVIPPIGTSGTIPGMGPKGAVEPPGPGQPGGPPALPGAPPSPAPPAVQGPPPTPLPGGMAGPDAPPAINAAGRKVPKPSADQVRLSRKLVDIDRDLRRSLQIAASASIRRTLEKAGAKLRTSVHNAKDTAAMSALTGVPSEHVGMTLGRNKVQQYGGSAVVKSDWSDVKQAYESWVSAAQEQALAIAQQLGGAAMSPADVSKARARLSAARAVGWNALSKSLDALAVSALYAPITAAIVPAPLDPGAALLIPPELVVSKSTSADVDNAVSVVVDPSTLAPTSTIRAVLALAGGSKPEDVSLDTDTGTIADADAAALPQIGTGVGLSDLLAEADMSTPGYQWVHGTAVREFDPHVQLDGVEFSSFDDDVLSTAGTDGDWVGEYFAPGDHDGCTCDFMPMWAASDVGDRPIDQVDDGSDDADDADDDAVAASGRPPVRNRSVKQ
jgi:hypothetical protein